MSQRKSLAWCLKNDLIPAKVGDPGQEGASSPLVHLGSDIVGIPLLSCLVLYSLRSNHRWVFIMCSARQVRGIINITHVGLCRCMSVCFAEGSGRDYGEE